ncbi:MAG: DUF222 domain-containing protein [Micromonosporaceae bacterium]
MAHAAFDYLTQVDAADLATQAKAECLVALQQLAAKHAAAQAKLLSAFSAEHGYAADGQHSPKTWLRYFTRMTGAAAGATVASARELAEHPVIADGLRTGLLSVSWARRLCEWTSHLPAEHTQGADEVLVSAARRGADLQTLAQLAAEIYARVCPPDRDQAGMGPHRYVRLGVTFGGAGRLEGDLTAEATAAVGAVLDALGGKAGPDDSRTRGQRRHDALAEACRRLIAAGLLPGRAGGDTRAEVVIGLRDLRALPGAVEAEQDWIAQAAARDAPVLTGPAAAAAACAASLVPIVTGHIDPNALDRLAGAYLNGTRRTVPDPSQPPAASKLKADLLRWAIEVVSGPAGLASRLRTGVLDGPLANPSLPLDIGIAGNDVPSHLRRALASRDRHCRFPGCRESASVCHPHHFIPRKEGGPTALHNLGLMCAFHHLIVIHTWGWHVALNPDGTITATSPAGKTLRSHSPPAVA